MRYLFPLVILTFILGFSKILVGQGVNCETPEPFCYEATFAAAVNEGSAEVGNNYDCLQTQPNPAWFYLEIAEPGAINIIETNSNSVDVDFALWGPFTGISDAINSCGEYQVLIDCSYSTNDGEDINIPESAIGEVYVLLLTNFSNDTTDVNLSIYSGTGGLTCDGLPCSLKVAYAGTDLNFCGIGEEIALNGSSFGFEGSETYTWSTVNPEYSSLLNQINETNAIFDSSGLPTDFDGDIDLFLTVEEDTCSTSSQIKLNFSSPTSGWWTVPSEPICSQSGYLVLVPNNTSSGYWLGEGVINTVNSLAIFDPSNLEGEIEISYIAVNGVCADTVSQIITVVEPLDASWNLSTPIIFENNEPIDLIPSNYFNGSWTGEGVTDNMDGTGTFNPVGLQDSIAISYTVDSLGCTSISTEMILVVQEDPTSGIAQISTISITELYPNPAHNILNVTYNAPFYKQITWQIYGVQGQLMESAFSNINQFGIDVSSLSAGIYFLVIDDNESSIRTRFVVER